MTAARMEYMKGATTYECIVYKGTSIVGSKRVTSQKVI